MSSATVSDPGSPPPRPALRARTVIATVLAAVAVAACVTWSQQPSPWALATPGPVVELPSGAGAEETGGVALLLTVTFEELRRYEAWTAAPAQRERTRRLDQLDGLETGPIRRILAEQQAAHLARRLLGDEPGTSDRWMVTASAAGLREGQVILAIDGEPVTGLPVSRLADARTVTVPGGELTVDLDAGTPVAVPIVDIDDDLQITTVGGSSGGVALAVALLERHGDGTLLADRRVAATGRLDHDGYVRPVVGVPAKVAAAVQADADVVFVPTGQQPAGADPVHVVEVSHIDDVIVWLCDTPSATHRLCR